MIVFSNSAANHILEKSNLPKGNCMIRKFSDGEVFVKINQEIHDKPVWIIASTQPSAENLLELFFLLDALTRSGVNKINIFFTYFAYARQSSSLQGEANSAHVICDMLKKYPISSLKILHVHVAKNVQKFLSFTNVIDFDFFCNIAKDYDVIASPDEGSFELAKIVAQACNKEVICFQKKRLDCQTVIFENFNSNVVNKKVVLVDDIISTGQTIIDSSKILKDLGAKEVSAAATHGVFAKDAHENIQASFLSKVFVTNSINCKSKDKVIVKDITKFIEKIIKE